MESCTRIELMTVLFRALTLPLRQQALIPPLALFYQRERKRKRAPRRCGALGCGRSRSGCDLDTVGTIADEVHHPPPFSLLTGVRHCDAGLIGVGAGMLELTGAQHHGRQAAVGGGIAAAARDQIALGVGADRRASSRGHGLLHVIPPYGKNSVVLRQKRGGMDVLAGEWRGDFLVRNTGSGR